MGKKELTKRRHLCSLTTVNDITVLWYQQDTQDERL